MQITKSLFPVGGAYPYVKQLNESLQELQVQLATQQKATTLSDLGSNRVFDLNLRARLSRLDAFKSNIDTTNLRLDFLDNSVSRLSEIESDTRGSMSSSGIGSDGINIATASQTAYNRLDEVLAILNSDLNGRYMFAGNKTDAPPVVSADALVNGSGSKAGLKTIIAERKAADFGTTSNLGRLVIDRTPLTSTLVGSTAILSDSANASDPTIASVTTDTGAPGGSNAAAITDNGGTPATKSVAFSAVPNPGETVTVTVQYPDSTTADYVFRAVSGAPTGLGEFDIGANAGEAATNFQAAFDNMFQSSSVTIAEDGNHGFGVKLQNATSDNANISVQTQTGAQPAAVQFRVNAIPDKGDTLSIAYALPDGTTGTFDLTATDNNPPGLGEFLIGGTTDQTAANIGDAVTARLTDLKNTDLAAASANKATEEFITTDGSMPLRVDPGGGDLAHATAQIAGTEANTVKWYTGQSTSTDARKTASARVDESTTVHYGVLGNEQGIANLIRANAVMAAETFSADDTVEPSGAARYQATAQRQVSRLAPTGAHQSGSLDVISLELSLAQASAGSASERHANYGSQLETMLSGIESVDVNEVAMQLLAVRTNLEASYQTMSTLSQLSLVNYMP